jgi:hypothetical protein
MLHNYQYQGSTLGRPWSTAHLRSTIRDNTIHSHYRTSWFCPSPPWLIMVGWECLGTAATNGPIVHPPGDMWAWRAMVVVIPAGDNSWLSTRALWQSYQQRHLEQGGGMDERVRFCFISKMKYLKGSFTSREILRQGTSGLLPIRRKVCCGFLSPLKIHGHGPDWTRDPCVQWQAH